MGDILLDKALAIDGWMSPIELRWLAEMARTKERIVEIGSYKGRSTRVLCDNTDGIVIAVDPWQGPYITDRGGILFDQSKSWPEFERNMMGVKNLEIFKGYFRDFTKTNIQRFDFVFIDGDHRYDAVVHDIVKGLDILDDDGILAGHDYTHPDWPGVRKAVDEIFPEAEKLDSIWWIQKS